jgi:RimJ/RimL family protein N-acetyltransferase
MHHWLGMDHVARWFGIGPERRPHTPEEVASAYARRARGESPTRAFIILHDDTPIGYIQGYAVRDWPEYAADVQLDKHAAGVDLFIGEPAYAYRGLGPLILRRFLREVSFADPAIESCIIGPEPANRAAIRAYEKAGFRYLKTIRESSGLDSYLMRIDRATFGSSQ